MASDPLTNPFSALADPTRRAILERLAAGDATVGELAEPFDMTLPAISKHLAVLERAGLIAKSRHGQQRLCRITATPPPLGGQPRQPGRLPDTRPEPIAG